MTGTTERHEVLLVISTTISSGIDVVDNHCHYHSPIAPAQFAKRMLLQVRFADLPPGSSVALT